MTSLEHVGTDELIEELSKRGAELMKSGFYQTEKIIIKQNYSVDRSERVVAKVLVLDHLDFK